MGAVLGLCSAAQVKLRNYSYMYLANHEIFSLPAAVVAQHAHSAVQHVRRVEILHHLDLCMQSCC